MSSNSYYVFNFFSFLLGRTGIMKPPQSNKYLNESGRMHQLSELFPFTVFKCLKIETLVSYFIQMLGVS